jgi:hypothetical protein
MGKSWSWLEHPSSVVGVIKHSMEDLNIECILRFIWMSGMNQKIDMSI